MKRVISSAKKKSSILIIGLLLLANLVAFGAASHYLKNDVQANIPGQEQVSESGWKVLGWSYSILKYLRFQPQG